MILPIYTNFHMERRIFWSGPLFFGIAVSRRNLHFVTEFNLNFKAIAYRGLYDTTMNPDGGAISQQQSQASSSASAPVFNSPLFGSMINSSASGYTPSPLDDVVLNREQSDWLLTRISKEEENELQQMQKRAIFDVFKSGLPFGIASFFGLELFDRYVLRPSKVLAKSGQPKNVITALPRIINVTGALLLTAGIGTARSKVYTDYTQFTCSLYTNYYTGGAQIDTSKIFPTTGSVTFAQLREANRSGSQRSGELLHNEGLEQQVNRQQEYSWNLAPPKS